MAELEKRNCPRGGAARHCTERADTPYLGRLVLLFGPRTTMPSRCENMYTMVLGCNSDDGGRRKRLKALWRGATHHCMQQACTPYLGLRVLWRGHAHRCHAATSRPDQALRVFFRVGVLLFCQPSVHHQSMSNAFSLVCCACTLSACSPLLTVRACHLHADI